MSAPEIRLNYLSTPHDQRVAANSMRFTRKIMAVSKDKLAAKKPK